MTTTMQTSAPATHPRVTPEMVEHYVREGRRLRALTLRRLSRQLVAALRARTSRGRRMGRLEPRAAR